MDDLINLTEALQIYSGSNPWNYMLDKLVRDMTPKKWWLNKDWKIKKIKVDKKLEQKMKT